MADLHGWLMGLGITFIVLMMIFILFSWAADASKNSDARFWSYIFLAFMTVFGLALSIVAIVTSAAYPTG